jgi:hypothetical protein
VCATILKALFEERDPIGGAVDWSADGLALGEEVAICFLQDQVNTFPETFPGFSFTRFDGTSVTITPGTGRMPGFIR